MLTNRKKTTLIAGTLTLFVSFVFILSAYAAGGGGGGGSATTPPPPSCDEDTWECSPWADCAIDGIQSRTCEMTFNCPTAETPKPSETMSCVPPCTQDTWTCSDWKVCDADGMQRRSCALAEDCGLVKNAKPPETQQCKPSCDKDVWECGDYGTCDDGVQRRFCSLSFDCPSADTPSPQTEQTCTVPCSKDTYECADWTQCREDGRQRRTCVLTEDCPADASVPPPSARVCPGLQCGHLDTLKDRIRCRLELSSDELAREFSILYFPEYCKAEEGTVAKNECIELYQSFGACWKQPKGNERQQCASGKIGITNFPSQVGTCNAMTLERSRRDCLLELKEKLEHLLLFNLYELEIWAEAALTREEASVDAVTELEMFIEERKADVEKDDSIQNWKRIVKEAQEAWREFKINTL